MDHVLMALWDVMVKMIAVIIRMKKIAHLVVSIPILDDLLFYRKYKPI